MVRIRAMASGLIAAWIAATSAFAAEAPVPETRAIALVGGLIRTQTEEGDFVGTLIVRDGKIVAIGRDVAVPADAARIDVSNHVITPGLIDAHGVLGLNAGVVRESGRDAALDIMDGVDPFANDWREAAKQGITAVYVQPTGSLGGAGAVLRVGPGKSAEDLAIRAGASVQATLGTTTEVPTQTVDPALAARLAQFGITLPAPQAQAPPASNTLTRYAQYESLRSQFDAAKKYGESKPARRDVAKELLLRAVKGEIPLRLEIGHEDDARNALQLTKDFGMRIVFEHVDRAKPIPQQLMAQKAAIVIGPMMGKKSPEVRKLALDGRRFALGTFGDTPQATHWLRMQAAAGVADGYPRDRMLKAMTSDAAQLLGAADQLGSLAVGRVADIAVFAGDPLDPSVPVRLTISQGVVTYDRPDVESVPTITAKPVIPERMPPRFVLKTNRLLNPAGEFAPGELYVENGSLSVASPGGDAPVIDVGDAPVTPGLVAGHVTIQSETAPDADAAHLRGGDGLAVNDPRLHSYRDAGFLTTGVAPGSGNVLAGTLAAVHSTDAAATADCGFKFVLGAASRTTDRYPQSLFGQVELLKHRLSGTPPQTELYLPDRVREALLAQRDRHLEAAKNRHTAAYFEAQTPAEIRASLRLIAEYKLRGVLLGPKQIDELVDEIKAARVGVVVGTVKQLDTDKNVAALAELGKAGVPLAFSGNANDMRASVAWLVNNGLPRPAARRGLIAQPPARFGLPPGSGRLDPGDPADFVIWDGDPVDLGSRPTAVISQGQRAGR